MTERQSRSSGFLDDMLPIPLKDWMAKHGFNNPQTALFFGFSTPAIQKMLTGGRELGVVNVGLNLPTNNGGFKIVETKKIEVLMLCPSLAYENRKSDLWWSGAGQYAFEEPEPYMIVTVLEPRGPRKTKDAEG